MRWKWYTNNGFYKHRNIDLWHHNGFMISQSHHIHHLYHNWLWHVTCLYFIALLYLLLAVSEHGSFGFSIVDLESLFANLFLEITFRTWNQPRVGIFIIKKWSTGVSQDSPPPKDLLYQNDTVLALVLVSFKEQYFSSHREYIACYLWFLVKSWFKPQFLS